MEQDFLPFMCLLEICRDSHSLAEGYKTWDKGRHREVASSSLVQKSLKDLSEMEEGRGQKG